MTAAAGSPATRVSWTGFLDVPVPRPAGCAGLPVDADRHQHGLATHGAVFPHLLVTGVQNQIRIRFFESPLGELLPLLVQRFYNAAHAGRTEFMPAQFFGDALYLARGYALHVHLKHGCDQRFSLRW